MIKTGIALAATALANSHYEFDFIQYMAKHNKSYGTEAEFVFRLEQYIATDLKIAEFNARDDLTSTIGHNFMSDWTAEEKSRMGNGRNVSITTEEANDGFVEGQSINGGGVDWRYNNVLNPIQNQGGCGSCWAFAATAQMEAAHAVATGQLLKLSEQMCVDCDQMSDGCGGGYPAGCMQTSQQYGGQPLESAYPYTGRDGQCRAQYGYGAATAPRQIVNVTPRSEQALINAIAQMPTTVAIDCESPAWQHYQGGIINDPSCAYNEGSDHIVLAVGFGTDMSTGQNYYIVRNSWGTGWGEQGYARIARTGDGLGICNIQLGAVWSHQ